MRTKLLICMCLACFLLGAIAEEGIGATSSQDSSKTTAQNPLPALSAKRFFSLWVSPLSYAHCYDSEIRANFGVGISYHLTNHFALTGEARKDWDRGQSELQLSLKIF
jgi:hypothetical protein